MKVKTTSFSGFLVSNSSVKCVKAADVSHEKDMAVVSMDAEVASDVLKEVVEAKDYKVLSIE